VPGRLGSRGDVRERQTSRRVSAAPRRRSRRRRRGIGRDGYSKEAGAGILAAPAWRADASWWAGRRPTCRQAYVGSAVQRVSSSESPSSSSHLIAPHSGGAGATAEPVRWAQAEPPSPPPVPAPVDRARSRGSAGLYSTGWLKDGVGPSDDDHRRVRPDLPPPAGPVGPAATGRALRDRELAPTCAGAIEGGNRVMATNSSSDPMSPGSGSRAPRRGPSTGAPERVARQLRNRPGERLAVDTARRRERTARSSRSGCRSANAATTAQPRELPTMVARSTPTASRILALWSASSGIVALCSGCGLRPARQIRHVRGTR
jgi:hypothetical protein